MTRDGMPPPAPAAGAAASAGGAGDGPRRCSQCGHHGHNARTCTARPVKLFGVRIGDKPIIRKSASMGNLAALAEGSGGGRDAGYGSEGDDNRPRKRGEAWSEEEHKNFLLGLQKLGRGDWRGIARNYVISRTPTQVASHAQKYFIRQTSDQKRKRRSSLFDMVIDDSADEPLSRISSQETEEYQDDLHLATASMPPPAAVPGLASASVPPSVQVMAPPAPVPVLTSASAPPPLPEIALQPEEKATSSNAVEAGVMFPQMITPYGYPMMLPPPYYYPYGYPVPYYAYPPFMYGSSDSLQASSQGSDQALTPGIAPPQAAHEVVRPMAVHPTHLINVDDLYTMSELSLRSDSNTSSAAPKFPLPPKPIRGSVRQSALHAKGHADGSPNGLIPAK